MKTANNDFEADSETANGSSSSEAAPDELQGGGASMAKLGDGESNDFSVKEQAELDDKGTNQVEASEILKQVRDEAFDSSNEKLALALGRPSEEIEQELSGEGSIDGDVLMKARGLAIQRGVETE